MENNTFFAHNLVLFFEKNEKGETTKIDVIKMIRTVFGFGLVEAKNIADSFYNKFDYRNCEKITWEHIKALLNFCDELKKGNFVYEDGKFYVTVKKEIEF